MAFFRKVINKYLLKFCNFFGLQLNILSPYLLHLEPTNHCNFHCPLCPTGNGESKREKSFMHWDLFVSIINEQKKFLYELYLIGFGEPLLHPNIANMVDYAENNDIKTYISTNASMLIKENILNKIIQSKLSVLMIAIDGATSQSYNKYRVGGNFENIYNIVKNINTLKEKYGNKKLVVQIQFIVMRHNENEIESIKLIAENTGVELRLKTVSVRSVRDLKYLPLNKKYRRYKTLNNLKPKNSQPKSCPRAWGHATIYSDGSVVSCCKDSQQETLFGFVNKENSFYSIWNSKAFYDFRKKQRLHKTSIGICKNCVIP